MDLSSEIRDEDFVPFLKNLGVDTYEKSFEWMLHDPNFSGVLKWLYNNLDQNNALTAREEYRYSELEDKGLVLAPDVLDTTISSLQESYPGLCLPGDKETKDDVQLDIENLSKRLDMLDRRDICIIDVTQELNTQLQRELTVLNAAHQQGLDDQSKAADECMSLARELESMTDEVINVIAKNIEIYANCRDDKDIAKKFFIFNPLDNYRQTQAMFQTQFQVFISEMLNTIDNRIGEKDFKVALSSARNLETRLSCSAVAYMESKAELRGAQSQLALVSNYGQIHPSQVRKQLIEALSALDMLKEEESLVEEEARAVAAALGERRARLVDHAGSAVALATRHHVKTSLTQLADLWRAAVALDNLLYYCLRHELNTCELFVQYAREMRQYVLSEDAAVKSRIKSMKDIISEQEITDTNRSNLLLSTLFTILDSGTQDETILVKLYNNVKTDVKTLEDNVQECYRKKENELIDIKTSAMPLRSFVYSGCTKKPSSQSRTVASLSHTLSERIDAVYTRMEDVGRVYINVKDGDKHNLRKLWQWFLTDPVKLTASLKRQGSD